MPEHLTKNDICYTGVEYAIIVLRSVVDLIDVSVVTPSNIMDYFYYVFSI